MIAGKLRRFVGLAILALMATLTARVEARPASEESRPALAPTYRIFATREGLVGRRTANGHLIQPRDRFVALPSWTVLSPRGSDKFRVRLTYNGRTVVVPVWDVGPWNTNDDYWSPNRRYKDLPVGMPMAQAAVLHGYNGGRDEFGRRIRDPNGIDIADGTFWDDLQMTRNDWVDVTFLWLGADPGPGNAVPIDVPAPAPAPRPASPPPGPVTVEPGAITVDNGDPGFAPSGSPWSEAACGLGGAHSWTYSTSDAARATALATWTPQLPGAGFYELRAYIPECGERATTSARYVIYHDDGVSEVGVDQQARAGTWVGLGTFRFGGAAGASARVELSDLTRDDRRAVRYDVLAWISRQDSAPPAAQVTGIQRKDNGYQITWGGTDDLSGIATYDVQVRILPRGGWTDWRRDVETTTAWFGPDEGKHFAFRVRARDRAGNVQPWPEGAQMDTTQATPQG
ncbi:MAG: hypothetical protein SNJ69_04020 [Chloroflexaceae bacterium]